ncbi:hypothetical protein LR013_03400 [candidate division NPL-UPA2 bacterium]|nr:hypothetical protein [candidate division NPL-UPA2 bacterium]
MRRPGDGERVLTKATAESGVREETKRQRDEETKRGMRRREKSFNLLAF